MKKYRLKIILITILLAALFMTATACAVGIKNSDIKISYDTETRVLRWYAENAVEYDMFIYREDGALAWKLERTASTDMPNLPEGKYRAIITAYDKKGNSKAKELVFEVNKTATDAPSDKYPDSYDPDYVGDSDSKSLRAAYYHLASDKTSLDIGLINESGIEKIEGFDMFDASMWKYDSSRNVLSITQTYLQRFSVGAILPINVVYSDGEESRFNVKIVDKIPPEVIGVKNSVIEVDLSSAYALNVKISLGYGDEVLDKGGIVNKVCVDYKKLSSLDYTLGWSTATVSLDYSRVINKLSIGRHKLDIYTVYGKTEAWLDVSDDREYPRSVKIDYDSEYPKIYVEWSMTRADAEEYRVEIGDATYSSKSDPQLFNGCRFDATDKIKFNDTVEIKAVFGGKEFSTASAKTKLDVNVFDQSVSKYLSYQNSFYFLGKHNNYFISDFDEFFDMTYYSLLFYDNLEKSALDNYEKSVTFYPLKSFLSDVKSISSCIKQVENRLNEATKSSYQIESLGNGAYRLHLKVLSSFIPDTKSNVASTLENFFQDTHLSDSGRADDFEDFAVNKIEKTAYVRYSEELYLVLERGIRPVPIAGSDAEKIYEIAKRVLRKIIGDDMSEYQKVHAMYDWMAKSTNYDWDIENKMSGIKPSDDEYDKFYKYRQFYLEGVFVDGVAVCNGMAKAMSLMCGIEGIECYKIKGTSRGGAHAWNKIKVDGAWYVCDSTWANRRYTDPRSGAVKEMLTHYTALMSEATSGNNYGGAHYENFNGDYSDCYAGEDYNVYANTFFRYNGRLYDYVIEETDDLIALIAYGSDKATKSGQIVSLDVQCSLSDLTQFIKLVGEVENYYLDATDFNARIDGVSTLIMTRK